MTTAAATVLAADLAAHRPRLMKYALLFLRNPAHAEDAVQDTLVAALEGVRTFAGKSSVLTWLVGILKHKMGDQFRRQSREPLLAPRSDEGAAAAIEQYFDETGHFLSPPADWGDPQAAFDQCELLHALERGLERLPAKTARAFHMREVMGCSTEEICEALGVSRENCWIMLFRARLSLRQHLEETGFTPR